MTTQINTAPGQRTYHAAFLHFRANRSVDDGKFSALFSCLLKRAGRQLPRVLNPGLRRLIG
jgi:hypothetical protein